MKRAIAATLLTLACCTSKVFGAAATATFTLETGVPSGFADLIAPRRLVVDIYYGGRPVGSAVATVDAYSLRFADPEALLALLPQTLDPQRVLKLLGREQPLNASRLCQNSAQRDCGFLTPDEFALIYDDSRFRADLFFSADLLPQQAAIETPYLPESSSDIAFVQNLTGTWSGVNSGSSESTSSASLFGQSILSFGESGLHSQWSTSDTGDSRIYQLHWSRDFRGRAYSAGLLQPRGGFSHFVASPYLYGVEYRSSSDSRTDDNYTRGAPLDINMPVRGRVEIYRDGRLLHSELLEAGNRLLDTRDLPGGAYEVEIRTYDESGRPLTQQRQLFTKDSLLPPPGEWRWALQAGRPAQVVSGAPLPEEYDDYFIQAGMARRLFDDTGLFANLAASGGDQLLELGGRWVGRYLELSPSLLQDTDGRSGHRLYAVLKTPLLNLSASETRLQDVAATEPGTDFTPLGSGYYQRNLSASGHLMGGNLTLRYTERNSSLPFDSAAFELDSESNGANRLTTLEYRRDFFRSRYWQGEWTLSHSDADGDAITTAAIEFRFTGNNWRHAARLRNDYGPGVRQSTRAGIDSTWNDGDLWAPEVTQQFSSETGDDEYYFGSRTRIAGYRGHLNAVFDYRDSEYTGAHNLNYLGSFSTNLLAGDGKFAWGGERTLQSAVLVDIAGSPEQDFEILVDGARRGYAKGNARSVINLPAFQSYEIQLRPLDQGFYDYREEGDTITLYPGNVALARYDIQPVILVLGRIIQDGKPVPHAKIAIGNYQADTDEFGLFQLEMHGDPRHLKVPPARWKNCKIELTGQASGKDWLNLGDVDLSAANCGKESDYAHR